MTPNDKPMKHLIRKGENKIRKHTSQAVCLGIALCCWIVAEGCMWFCPRPSLLQRTTLGRVEFDDFATCRRLRVIGHESKRDVEGKLTVTVVWQNKTRKAYKARVRVSFFDNKGLAERGSYNWYLQTFRPGAQTISWTSYTVDAARYRIDVEKD